MKHNPLPKLACLFLVLSLLAGCGQSSQPVGQASANTAGTQVQKTAQSNEVVFYYWDDQQKAAMDEMIAAFEKENPGIKVTSNIVPWDQYWTKVQVMLGSSSAMDALWVDERAQEYQASGLLYDIQPLIDKDKVDLSVFPKVTLDKYTYSGKLWGIPKECNTFGIYYNKELFDKAGVPYPTDDWTWDDLLSIAQKLTKTGATFEDTQYGFVSNPAVRNCVNNFIYSNGGRILSPDGTKVQFNSPEAKEATQFLLDLMYKYKVSPTWADQQEMTGDFLVSGKAAMLSDGSWMVSYYDQQMGKKVGIAPLPKSPKTQKRESMVTSIAFVIPAKAPHPDAAWKFLKFQTTKEAGDFESEVVMPANINSVNTWLQRYPNEDAKVFADATNYSVAEMPAKPVSNFETIYSELFTNLWFGGKDINSLFSQYEQKLNGLLEKAK